jgi:hypothetical protein
MLPRPGSLVGRGRTAEILAWETGWVLKLFYSWVPEAAAQREYQLARQAHIVGAITPAVKEFVSIDNRFGFVLERVNGPTLLTVLTSQPWRLLEAAHLLAGLQAGCTTASRRIGPLSASAWKRPLAG